MMKFSVNDKICRDDDQYDIGTIRDINYISRLYAVQWDDEIGMHEQEYLEANYHVEENQFKIGDLVQNVHEPSETGEILSYCPHTGLYDISFDGHIVSLYDIALRRDDQLRNNTSEAKKCDQEKTPVDLLPPEGLLEIAKVLEFGAKKYDAHNWRKGMKWSRLLGASLRHIYAFVTGEDKDSESGLSHLAHAGCCILFLLTYETKGLGTDDRYKS